jgi:hypothetical protein
MGKINKNQYTPKKTFKKKKKKGMAPKNQGYSSSKKQATKLASVCTYRTEKTY